MLRPKRCRLRRRRGCPRIENYASANQIDESIDDKVTGKLTIKLTQPETHADKQSTNPGSPPLPPREPRRRRSSRPPTPDPRNQHRFAGPTGPHLLAPAGSTR